MSAPAKERCKYCRRRDPATSDYEQMSLISGEWSRLCLRCADKRLRNPFAGALGTFRHIVAPAASTSDTPSP